MPKIARNFHDQDASGARLTEGTVTNILTPAEYQSIHDFLEGRAGIRLGAGKEYLVTSRLGSLLPMFDLAGYTQLVAGLSRPDTGRLQKQ